MNNISEIDQQVIQQKIYDGTEIAHIFSVESEASKAVEYYKNNPKY